MASEYVYSTGDGMRRRDDIDRSRVPLLSSSVEINDDGTRFLKRAGSKTWEPIPVDGSVESVIERFLDVCEAHIDALPDVVRSAYERVRDHPDR